MKNVCILVVLIPMLVSLASCSNAPEPETVTTPRDYVEISDQPLNELGDNDGLDMKTRAILDYLNEIRQPGEKEITATDLETMDIDLGKIMPEIEARAAEELRALEEESQRIEEELAGMNQ